MTYGTDLLTHTNGQSAQCARVRAHLQESPASESIFQLPRGENSPEVDRLGKQLMSSVELEISGQRLWNHTHLQYPLGRHMKQSQSRTPSLV